jgi:hypothetical protein
LTAHFTYQAGSEFAPGDPYGQEVLTLTADGRFTYERRHQGTAWTRAGRADPAVLAGIEQALQEAAFPAVPLHSIPPGASLISITAHGKTAALDYFKGRKFAGYNHVIQVCDGWNRWLRKADDSAEPPAGLFVEG